MADIKRQVTVVRDGMHNAFTDLQYWQGVYWCGYRKGAGHISQDARAVIAVSDDRKRFTEVAALRVKGDVRDPKLLPLGDDRMACYFPSWTHGARDADHRLQQYITFSSNGADWETPQPILPPKNWLWRIRKHDGRYYALIQNLSGEWNEGKPPHQLDLAVSDDLLNWEVIARVGEGLNESDIYWHDNGEAWIVARTISREPIGSAFAKAKPPYTDWDVTYMRTMCHAAVMLEHNGEIFVAGRSKPATEDIHDVPFKSQSIGVWRVTEGNLESVLRIPATGDCSYCGLIKDPEGRICMSYYSQHAYHLGVIPVVTGAPGDETWCPVADVYFAELELP